MKKDNKVVHTILIADDSEMNRSLLTDMLGSDYNILEAADGTQAISCLQNEASKIDLVLLDMVMPKMDGFEVLAFMNRNGWIKDIPVILISSEASPSCMERAYELGVTDFINRPFDVWIVRRRVMNTLMLASKQKMLVGMVTDQIFQREKMSNLMITILSHIVEFRNGESGMHVLHIRNISELILKSLVIKTNKYGLNQNDISLISTASALHDIGKIGIPDHILNKPSKLTEEEFQVMKTHSALGATMLDDLEFLQDENLVQYARQICRWHHERYDGKGYPDGLKGEDIPIAAQVVSLADVYDALTSSRVYKTAYSHQKALEMILNGECGAFNPILIDCLLEIQDKLAAELKMNSLSRDTQQKMQHVTDEILEDDELYTSVRTLTLLENERTKTRFFAELSHELQFEYSIDTGMLMLYDFGKKKLGLDELILNPIQDENILRVFGKEQLERFIDLVKITTPRNYAFNMEVLITLNEENRWMRVSGRSLFRGEPAVRTGIIGKIIDVSHEHQVLKELQHKATHDQLTLLYNASTAKERIETLLKNDPTKEYVMLILDLDYFKTINDAYGHDFGNHALQHVADKLRLLFDDSDIVSRIGGDEFLIFFKEDSQHKQTIESLFQTLIEPYNDLQISVSIGVAQTSYCGRKYETLFNCADRALYKAKKSGKHCIQYFDEAFKEQHQAFTTIDAEEESTFAPLVLSSKEEVTSLLKDIRSICERVYLTDVTHSLRFSVEEDGTYIPLSIEENYIYAGRVGAYEKALMMRNRTSGIAYRGNTLYYVSAIYFECGSAPYIIELMVPMGDELRSIGSNATDAIGIIDRFGRKKYMDLTLNIYNRLYFEEQLAGATNFYSIAIIKMEKSADVLEQIVTILYDHIRSTDVIIRLNEEKLLILFKNIQESHFTKLTRRIYDSLSTLHCTVGSYHALGKLEDLVEEIEINMQDKKDTYFHLK